MIGSALAVCIVAVASVGQNAAEPYDWPLDLPRELTSSFAEYRPGRYHMVIDLRTGPIGKNVYAADDGEIVRIACSPYGYGKAIYLQVRDGNTIVYAHLNEFMPPLAEYVRRAQHQQKDYTVNLYPKSGDLRVTRGQLIAKSGQTGIGVPHLHYEIRGPGAVPVNPGLLGIQWPDDSPPVFRKIAIVPLEPEARVNGDVLPVVRELARRADGSYRSDGIEASGPVALAADVYDPAAGGSKLGVYRLTLSVNGEQQFALSHEHLSYDQLNDGAAAYEPALRDRGQFLWLWRKPGNESEIYPQHGPDGQIEVSASTREISVVAEDFAGNQVTMTLPIRFATGDMETVAPSASTGVDTGRGAISYEYTGTLLVVTATFTAPESSAPVLRVEGANPDRLVLRRTGSRTFRSAYKTEDPIAIANLSVEHPRINAVPERMIFLNRAAVAAKWSVQLGGMNLSSASSRPYGFAVLRGRPATAQLLGDELTPVMPAVELWPTATFFDGDLSLDAPLLAGIQTPRQVMLYRFDRDDWDPLTRVNGPDGAVRAETSRLGVYALLRDAVPPLIHLIDLADGATLSSRRAELKAAITDRGSGIERFTATWNGQWLLMEYDPEQDLLRWERDEDLPPGPGTLAVEVADRAGNVSKRSVGLTVPN